MPYTDESESCKTISDHDQPKIFAAHCNDLDVFSEDSEPTIAELVGEWCLQGPDDDCLDADLLSMFPYRISESLHNIAPSSSCQDSSSSCQESTVTSHKSP